MDKIIKISTELYLLNYLYREKVIVRPANGK